MLDIDLILVNAFHFIYHNDSEDFETPRSDSVDPDAAGKQPSSERGLFRTRLTFPRKGWVDR